ncbi:MAG: 3-hydroxyacyl-ACP dehydratase FabZ [Acidobacteria bacterium]|nr:3-hydroxyacyl-ACP dehydratase FabZ [Acidobacteriota bacterium]MBI3656408.1 3-hydroxyacyl-ACP dehydratase FabZ [Acidobacteriota bacterium]
MTIPAQVLPDICEISKLLPHRYPFLLIDRILEFEPGKRIVGLKNVTMNEPFFVGHFPGTPVMPGVLIIEAMAQTGGVLALYSEPRRDKLLVYFLGIDKARFRRPVTPGDQLLLELTVLRRKTNVCKMQCQAFVNGLLVAEAEILSSFVERT